MEGSNYLAQICGIPKRKKNTIQVPEQKPIEIGYSNEKRYSLCLKEKDFNDFLYTLEQREEKILAFDIETAPLEDFKNVEWAALDPHKSDICGISFSHTPNEGIYLPLTHKIGNNFNGMSVHYLDDFIQYLDERIFYKMHILKIAHNISFESMFFYKHDSVIQPPCFDTIAAAMLSFKNKKEFRTMHESGLKTLTEEIFHVKRKTFDEITGGCPFDELDPADPEVLFYTVSDSDDALQLHDYYQNWFKTNIPRHYKVVQNIESPTAVYCGIMKYNGILVDHDLMITKKIQAETKILELEAKINQLAGQALPIGKTATTKAFKAYLFEELKLPVLKTTEKEAEAADDETFILLKDYCIEKGLTNIHELLSTVQEFRRWGKLLSTYIDGYIKYINPVTNRIHADPMPLKTVTGRFAYQKPNLQNCFDEETEILTINGWKLFAELSSNELVAQWENGNIEFVRPLQYIKNYYEGELIYLKNQHINMAVTKDHNCLLKNRKTKINYIIEALNYNKDAHQLHSGKFAFGEIKLTRELIVLLAATQADGHYHDNGIDFAFYKKRKADRLITVLQKITTKYSYTEHSNGRHRIRIKKSFLVEEIKYYLGEDKIWGKWLLDLHIQNIEYLLKELMFWDGSFTRKKNYSSSKKTNIDWIQILFTLTDKRAHYRTYKNESVNCGLNYQLDITYRNYSGTANIKKELKKYKGFVYCVSVPSKFIVVRRHGQVVITGNCPRKANDLVGIRKFFIPRLGYTFLDFDFSQIELRVGAFFCRDEKMLETYRKQGGDIHGLTTTVIYKIPFEEAVDKNNVDYKERRNTAKSCNFGTFFGLFANGLQRTLKFDAGINKSKEDCEEIIQNLKNGYPDLEKWQTLAKSMARKTGYTETYLGRRRILKDINSRDWGTKSFMERCALNTPIQGTAADILKLALGRILEGLLPRIDWLIPVLQVHDELLFECRIDKIPEAIKFIKNCMEKQPFPEFDLPIVAEGATGKSFGEMEEIE